MTGWQGASGLFIAGVRSTRNTMKEQMNTFNWDLPKISGLTVQLGEKVCSNNNVLY